MANDEFGLKEKVAIVSGGGGPVGSAREAAITNGRAAAILLARAGAKICVVARSLDLAGKTVEMIESEGGEAFAFAADVTREDDCRSVVEATLERFGRLDCLDNNVGTSASGNVTQISIERWREVFSINVESMVMMCKYAIPAMVANGGGSIVNISSLRSIRPQNSTVYSVSKGAVNALTATLAADHGASGVRVNGIILGPVYTPAVAPMLTAERRQTRIDASLIKREGTGWDTGHLVRFLLSEQARFITGQNICLDGGISLIGPQR